jgi:DNA-binding PucR family transcriptional regulator
VYIARDLIRRGLEEMATTAYRVGQSQALRYFVSKAFEFTDDPVLLRELLDTVAWSISDFVESTVTRVTEMMSSERAEILRGSQPEVRETVALLLDGAPITQPRAESRLAYRLSQAHTAVVVWSAEPDVNVRSIDDVVETQTRWWKSRPLIIRPARPPSGCGFPGPKTSIGSNCAVPSIHPDPYASR